MKYFKAPNNSIHGIDENFLYLLPDGCIEISENEAQVLSQQLNEKLMIEIEKDRLEKLEKLEQLKAKLETQ